MKLSQVPIKQYLHDGKKAFKSIKFKSMKDLTIFSDICKPRKKLTSSGKWGIFSCNSNLIGRVLRRDINGEHPGKTIVNFLPIINLNPSDESCIYSTLLFVEQQVQQLNIPSPCTTFHQPLFIKAFKISQEHEHCYSIGRFSSPSVVTWWNWNYFERLWLAKTMEAIFAPNSVVHMLKGKAYLRAL